MTTYTIETPFIRIWMEDHIVHCAFRERSVIDLESARHCTREKIALLGKKSHPCLVDLQRINHLTNEAKEYFEDEGSLYGKAGALVTKSGISTMIGNFFLSIKNNSVPIKNFTDRRKALEWLEQYL